MKMSPFFNKALAIVLCATHALAEDADHAEHGGEHGWAWAGLFDLHGEADHPYLMSFSKKAGKYADSEMQVFIVKAETIHDGEDAAEAAFKTVTNAVSEITTCSGAIAPASNAHHLEFDKNSPTSQYKLTVPADGHYAIFLQHMPEEFGDGEFLQSTNGDHVEAEATEKAGEEAKPAKGSQVGIVILAVCVCTLLATIIPLVVALSVKNPTTLKPLISRFYAAAGGIVLALTVLHLYAEAIEAAQFNAHICLLIGFCVNLLIDSFTPAKTPESKASDVEAAAVSPDIDADDKPDGSATATGAMNSETILAIVSDIFCHVADGCIIAAAFVTCPALGWSVTMAITVHEVPSEISEFSIMVKNGVSTMKAICVIGGMGIISIVAAVITVYSEPTAFTLGCISAVGAGMLLYLVACKMLPNAQANAPAGDRVQNTILFFLGLGIGIASMQWHPACGGHHDHGSH